MADDQQLWGYPEVAAHLGISASAVERRGPGRRRGRQDTTPASTGPVKPLQSPETQGTGQWSGRQ